MFRWLAAIALGFAVLCAPARAFAETGETTLEVGDLILVTLHRPAALPPTSYKALVKPDGTVAISIEGAMELRGRTAEEASSAVQERLRAKGAEGYSIRLAISEKHDHRTTPPGPIAPGDRLEFAIERGYPRVCAMPRFVNEDGTIDVPQLRERVQVAGLTELEAQEKIVQRGRDCCSFLSVIRTGVAPPKHELQRRGEPIAIGDLLALHFDARNNYCLENPIMTRVGVEGTIRLPDIGERKVAGKSCTVAMRDIEAERLCMLTDFDQVVFLERVETASTASVKPGPIVAGDGLLVRLTNLEDVPGVETHLRLLVPQGGAIELPLLGSISLAGLSERGTEEAIVRAYRDRNVIRDTTVLVLRIPPQDVPSARASATTRPR
jgi:protein involved in polysaccharide export with SLBB domain